MTHHDLDDTETSTAPDPFVPEREIPVVTYPDGTTDEVDPHYEIIVAASPSAFYDDLEATGVTRLELTEQNGGEFHDHDAIMEAIGDGFQQFAIDGGSIDGLIEKVYTREVGGAKSLCLVIRSPQAESDARSRLTLAIDEALRDALTDD